MSYVFYGFWDPWLCSLLVFSTAIDFWCGRNIALAAERHKKKWLWLSLGVNLCTLGFFKYFDFFVYEFCVAFNMLGFSLSSQDYILNLVLPVGISFYTFQTMAYSIDLYRGDIEKPEPSFSRFALYISFFPQLIAGPVERAQHLLPQFYRPFRLNKQMVMNGIFLILLGFVKKVVIADRIARTIEPHYENVIENGVHAIASMLLFTCQIYVDCSSYSDIGIGLGLLLGYNIRPNFNLSFVVPSISEHWRRWHLSMSHWFRDYIFIPLGGSRNGVIRTQINIMIVMLLSGLWHSASNNFLMWGIGNGISLVVHKALHKPLLCLSEFMSRNRVLKTLYFYLCCLTTFCLIATINIFFRCPDWTIAMSYMDAIFYNASVLSLKEWSAIPGGFFDSFGWVFLIFCIHEAQRYWNIKEFCTTQLYWWIASCLIMFLSIMALGISGPQFIYYQF